MPATSRSAVPKKRASQVKRVRARRDLEALAARRLQAAEMFEHGRRQVDVVAELGVPAQSGSRWHRAWAARGRDGLAGAGRAGRRRKLTGEPLAEVEAALEAGPRANGFPARLWTLARVAEVIGRATGIRYSRTQTWTVLRKRLGWTRQRPARRAVERDEEAIAAGVNKDWPRMKKAPGAAAPGLSSKTSPGSPCCRRCGPPGRRAARPRCCGTGSAGRGCRCPARSATGPTPARRR